MGLQHTSCHPVKGSIDNKPVFHLKLPLIVIIPSNCVLKRLSPSSSARVDCYVTLYNSVLRGPKLIFCNLLFYFSESLNCSFDSLLSWNTPRFSSFSMCSPASATWVEWMFVLLFVLSTAAHRGVWQRSWCEVQGDTSSSPTCKLRGSWIRWDFSGCSRKTNESSQNTDKRNR